MRSWLPSNKVAAVLVVMGICFPVHGKAAALPLVTDGTSVFQIVIGPEAEEPERFAADELSRYLFEMSGARLPFGMNAGQ